MMVGSTGATEQGYLDDVLIEVSSVEELDRSQILDFIERRSAVVIRGLISPTGIVDAKRRIGAQFRPENDHASTGETPEDLYNNHQKLSINGGEFRHRANPQCVRTFYNPLFADDLFGMHEPFRAAARLRNLLMEMPLDFAVDRIEDGWWTAARIHQYPTGGGFMGRHREDYIPEIYEEHGFRNAYMQPLIVMSRKGTGDDCDYRSGGGYFCDATGKVYFESSTELGDVLVYDTTVEHGVSEIDVDQPFRQASSSGRYAGFVTLYRDFTASS